MNYKVVDHPNNNMFFLSLSHLTVIRGTKGWKIYASTNYFSVTLCDILQSRQRGA